MVAILHILDYIFNSKRAIENLHSNRIPTLSTWWRPAKAAHLHRNRINNLNKIFLFCDNCKKKWLRCWMCVDRVCKCSCVCGVIVAISSYTSRSPRSDSSADHNFFFSFSCGTSFSRSIVLYASQKALPAQFYWLAASLMRLSCSLARILHDNALYFSRTLYSFIFLGAFWHISPSWRGPQHGTLIALHLLHWVIIEYTNKRNISKIKKEREWIKKKIRLHTHSTTGYDVEGKR